MQHAAHRVSDRTWLSIDIHNRVFAQLCTEALVNSMRILQVLRSEMLGNLDRTSTMTKTRNVEMPAFKKVNVVTWSM